MKPVNYPNAILAPIFPENTPKNGFIFFAAIIAVLIFSLPADVPSFGFSATLYEFFKIVPEINIEVRHSTIPFPTAVGYGFTLCFAPLLALITCFSRVNKQALIQIMSKMTLLYRIWFFFAMLTILCFPFFFYMDKKISSVVFSSFLEIKRKNLFMLYIYSVSMMLFHAFIWTYICFQITSFFHFLTRKIYDR